jgi:hypothetical protein
MDNWKSTAKRKENKFYYYYYFILEMVFWIIWGCIRIMQSAKSSSLGD